MVQAQDFFHSILLTVVGGAFGAAGFSLNDNPIKLAGGQFRFVRPADETSESAAIVFQHLAYQDTEWSSGMPSRFKVILHHPDGTRRDLSALVVEDFGVAILPSAAHWWTYRNTEELGQALAEAGHLIVGYGLPWLNGDLTP